mgnify:FL=1
MRKTKKEECEAPKLLVHTEELKQMLCAGRAAAVRIGTDAEAKVQSGRRVLWNVKKVQKYIDMISE